MPVYKSAFVDSLRDLVSYEGRHFHHGEGANTANNIDENEYCVNIDVNIG